MRPHLFLCALVLAYQMTMAAAKPVFGSWERGRRKGKRPRYSNVRCLHSGGAGLEEGEMLRSCHYKDICFDDIKNSRGADATRPTFYAAGEVAEPMGVSIATPLAEDKFNWLRIRPKVVFGEIPEQGTCYETGSDFDLSLFFAPHNGANIGHLMYETYYSAFSAMATFGVLGARPNILQRRQSRKALNFGCDQAQSRSHKALCDRFWKVLPPMFNTTRVDHIDVVLSYAMATPGCKRACFRNLLAGFGAHTAFCMFPHYYPFTNFGRINYTQTCNVGRGLVFREFRAYTRKTLGLAATDDQPLLKAAGTGGLPDGKGCKYYLPIYSPRGSPSARNNAVAWRITAKAMVMKANQILSSSGTNVCVQRLDMDMSKVNMAQQVKFLSHVAIAITSCGGSTVFSATYLPEGAHLLMFCKGNATLDIVAYSAMPHLGAFHYVSMPGNQTLALNRMSKYLTTAISTILSNEVG